MGDKKGEGKGIEIRSDEGLGTCNRVWVKSFMEQFGEVLHVHKTPSSGDPTTDVAFIRFAKKEQAERAFDTLNSGEMLLMGKKLKVSMKGTGKGPKPRGGLNYNTVIEDSRTLALEKSGGDRSRSRSRGGDRSRSRSGGDRGRGGGSRRDDSRGRRSGGGARRDDSRGRGRQAASRGRSRGGSRRDDSRDRGRRNGADSGGGGDRGGGKSRRDDSRARDGGGRASGDRR